MCLFGLLLDLIPLSTLMWLTGLVAVLAAVGYWRRWVRLALFMCAMPLQALVLVIWESGLTVCGAHCQHPFPVGQRVLDPNVQQALTGLCWAIAVFVLVSLGAARVHLRETGKTRHPSPITRGCRVAAVVLQLFIMLCLTDYDGNLGCLEPSLARSVSPDGAMEISAIPMGGDSDTPVVVIGRWQGDFWWRSLALRVIHFGGYPVEFAWDPNSSACALLMDGECDSRYDPASGRVTAASRPAETQPAAVERPRWRSW